MHLFVNSIKKIKVKFFYFFNYLFILKFSIIFSKTKVLSAEIYKQLKKLILNVNEDLTESLHHILTRISVRPIQNIPNQRPGLASRIIETGIQDDVITSTSLPMCSKNCHMV